MTISRRQFLAATSVSAVGIHPSLRSFLVSGSHPRATALAHPAVDPAFTPDDPAIVKAIALRAVEAAVANGASYADVRLIRNHYRWITFALVEGGGFGFSVRALVDGRWGLVSSSLGTLDEAARIGHEAAEQAKATKGTAHADVTLAPAPVVRDGNWIMPVDEDPFETPIEEIFDEINGVIQVFAFAKPDFAQIKLAATFIRYEKTFASSEGSFTHQRIYQTDAELEVQFTGLVRVSDRFSVAGRGVEYLRGHLEPEVVRCIEDAKRIAALPVKPVDVGRYDVLFDASTTAKLLDQTLGAATEVDRAMGYEANATGTSYLSNPRESVGVTRVGAPTIDVTGNRDVPHGAATVQWDDEGIVPDHISLVTGGMLTDYQTGRESASWLGSTGSPRRSHGCAGGFNPGTVPMIHTPNLRLAPAQSGGDLDDLKAATTHGLLMTDATVRADPNCLTGITLGNMFEIRNGRVRARLANAAVLFNALDLWKNVKAIGGPSSVKSLGVQRGKGEPAQQTGRTIEAPPVMSSNVIVVDPLKRA